MSVQTISSCWSRTQSALAVFIHLPDSWYLICSTSAPNQERLSVVVNWYHPWKKSWGVLGAKIGDAPVPDTFITKHQSFAEEYELSFLNLGYHSTIVQCYRNWTEIKDKLSYLHRRYVQNSKDPCSKQLLDIPLPCVFLGKTLGVPVACSPCSPFFQLCLECKRFGDIRPIGIPIHVLFNHM